MRRHPILKASAAAISSGVAISMMAISPAAAQPPRGRGITTRVVTATATVAANNTGEADATCGAGELLLGGGYAVQGTSTAWRIYVDAPLNDTSWLVEPVNFSSQPLTFSAYAICARSMPGRTGIGAYTTHEVWAGVDAPSHNTAEAEVSCPAGELRTGGGYDVFNISSNWSIYVNAPFGSDIWNVEIDNEVPLTTTFHSYAVCLAKKNGDPITNLSVSTVYTSATAAPYSVQSADVSCGHSSVLTGGGHEIASIGPYWSIQASAPTPTRSGWQVKVADLDNYSRPFSPFAVCLARA